MFIHIISLCTALWSLGLSTYLGYYFRWDNALPTPRQFELRLDNLSYR